VLNRHLLEALLRDYGLSFSSRCVFVGVGGAAVRPEVFKLMKECFSDDRVYESYGTTAGSRWMVESGLMLRCNFLMCRN